jgi:hypothetical protein
VYLFVGTSDFRPQLQALRDMARERAFGMGKFVNDTSVMTTILPGMVDGASIALHRR